LTDNTFGGILSPARDDEAKPYPLTLAAARSVGGCSLIITSRKVQAMQEIDELGGAFESPESSTVAGAEYDAGSEVLIVRFRRSKSEDRYRYSVPPKVWRGFLDAPSKGSYFTRFIRPLYDGEKL
jgi:hypothetical protein